MKLPDLAELTIPPAKITDYLLSPTHPEGMHKALFFQAFGFSRDRPQQMTQALMDHARCNDIAREEPSPYGKRYLVDGILEVPDGRRPHVRVVWFWATGERKLRLVTAHPLKREGA